MHPDTPAYAGRALVHAAPFLATSLLAFLIRPESRRVSLTLAMCRGVVGGLRDAAGAAGHVSYKPSG